MEEEVPPFIKDGDKVIGQTAVVLDYVALRIGLVLKVEERREVEKKRRSRVRCIYFFHLRLTYICNRTKKARSGPISCSLQ